MDDLTPVPVKGYVTGEYSFKYPKLGDEKPIGSPKVLLLTKGGICITGPWDDSGAFIGWAPLPHRDHAREDLLR